MFATILPQDVARARLRDHFTRPISNHPEGWSELWDAGEFLPWDRNEPSPAFVDTLGDRHDLLGTCFIEDSDGAKRRKRALVPGCGRGYDVLLLASFGYDAWGLDVSETAVKRCLEEQKTNAHKYPAKDESTGSGTSTFLTGNFFSDEWSKSIPGRGKFELIFDYTFFCALSPTMRPAWSLRYSQLLAPAPTGNLICLEFPTQKPPSTGGPPHASPPEVYVEHLSHPGEEIPYDEEGNVKGDSSKRARSGGLERVAHWQPERTHAVGKGTDWVSIWRHR